MQEITINPLLSARHRAVTKGDNCDAQLGSCRDNKRQPECLPIKPVLARIFDIWFLALITEKTPAYG